MKVYIMLNMWNDRHGTSGNRIRVYDTMDKAVKAMKEDIEDYKSDQCDLDLEPDFESDDSVYIDVDHSGTNSEWNIVEKEVE